MKSGSNKGKKKFYKCLHHEHYYDDLSNVSLCHSKYSGCSECRCKNIFQMNSCPLFSKSDVGFFLKMDRNDKKSVKEFLNEIKLENSKKEAEERALLKYLKEKYER